MNSFEIIVGLEVHVQLNTKTKIFCACSTEFGKNPNSHTCPVCLGLPGSLPVLNKEAVKKAISFGVAIDGIINQNSTFDRKNYFYPDLPKAYQITQFNRPIVEKGKLQINVEGIEKTIHIARAHMEEDAGKSIHEGEFSKIDLNRAGIPLLEIVTQPDLRSSKEAVLYLKKLHNIVRFLDISDANMQEGSFRCDANVSIRPKGDTKFYTRVEIKNLNSFKFIQKAIDYEVERQIDAWERGSYEKEVVQETRLFDSVNNTTRSMRNKEEASDYRYFPDPDLLPIFLDENLLLESSNIPEMPDQKRARYIKDLGIKEQDASLLTTSLELNRYFENLLNFNISPKSAITWLTTELLGRLKEGSTLDDCGVEPSLLAQLIHRIKEGKISNKSAKEVLDVLVKNKGGDVDCVIDSMGLTQIHDEHLIYQAIDSILQANKEKVEEYKNGKDKLFGFFVGQVMKICKGGNPSRINELLKERLSK